MAALAKQRGSGGRIGPATAVLVVAWVTGQVARDAVLPTAWLFYVPSLVWALALAGVAAMRQWRGRPAAAAAIAALAILAVELLVEHRWFPAANRGGPAPAAPITLVHWNISGGWREAEAQLETIRALGPDVLVLSEANERAAGPYDAALDGYEVRTFGALTVAARGSVDGEWIDRQRELQTVFARCRVDGRDLGVLAVNLASSLRIAREPLLEQVLARVAERRPDFVIGDFNAPRRSRALARLPAGWRHAYAEAGRGWSATWPQPLPLLAIDQLLVGPGWTVTDYRLLPGAGTDHRLQVAVLEAAPDANR